MFKNFIIILLSALFLVSCGKIASRMSDEQIKSIENAKETAIDDINSTKDHVVKAASSEINKYIATRLDSAASDISNVMSAAKEELSSQVKNSTDNINNTVSVIEARNQLALMIGCCAFILAVITFIITIRTSNKLRGCLDKIHQINKMNDFYKDNIYDINKNLNSNKLSSMRSLTRNDVQKEIDYYFRTPGVLQTITNSVIEKIGQEKQGEKIDTPTASSNDITNSVIELYARDSSNNDDLTDITTKYLPGKTVYRLILSSTDANEAEIDLCLDKEDAKQRILEMGEDLLNPICKVVRNDVSPTVVTVKGKGKAVKIEQNGVWHVVKQIYVEFN